MKCLGTDASTIIKLMPRLGEIRTIFRYWGLIGPFVGDAQHTVVMVSAQQLFIKMKLY